MDARDKYLNNPCETAIGPYYNTIRSGLRRDMLIVNDEKYNEILYRDYDDTKFIKMVNDYEVMKMRPLNDHYFLRTVGEDNLKNLVNLFNVCYDQEKINQDDVTKMRKSDYCHKDFWIYAFSKREFTVDKEKKEKIYPPIGFIIADYDEAMGEVFIKYLGIKEEYRERGLAYALLKELIFRAYGISQFTTVTFPMDNPYNLQSLFLKTNFKNPVVWHQLKKKTEKEPTK